MLAWSMQGTSTSSVCFSRRSQATDDRKYDLMNGLYLVPMRYFSSLEAEQVPSTCQYYLQVRMVLAAKSKGGEEKKIHARAG